MNISSTQTATLPYDPWADINDDGKIDIKDIAYTAAQFGTFGDPTKNVTVINWPVDEEGNLKVSIIHRSTTFILLKNYYLGIGESHEVNITVEGFRNVHLYCTAVNYDSQAPPSFTIKFGVNVTAYIYSTIIPVDTFSMPGGVSSGHLIKSYTVMGSSLFVFVKNPSTRSTARIYVYAYLTT